MKWRLNYEGSKLCGATCETGEFGSVCIDGHGWKEFIDWNAKQLSPLDLSDKIPPLPLPDESLTLEEIRALRDLLKQRALDSKVTPA